MNAQNWINLLGMSKHPLGGYGCRLEDRCGFVGKGCSTASSYRMLKEGETLGFHQVKQSQVWHYYAGQPMWVYFLVRHHLLAQRLGKDPSRGELPMLSIPEGTLVAAEVESRKGFTLFGVVLTGVDVVEPAALPDRDKLLSRYPEHRAHILRMSRA